MAKVYTKHSWVNDAQPPISANNLNQIEQGIADAIEQANDDETAINEHIDNKDNPHGVTAAQVGLGNVDNTADADKPVSSATREAIDAEITRAKEAESTNATAISTEVTRAKNAESGLDTRVKANEAYVQNALKFTVDSDNFICVE